MLISDFTQIISSDLDWRRFSDPCKVIALVRNKKHAQDRFKKYKDDEKFVILLQDVCSEINVHETIDFIIHAASPASPKAYKNTPLDVIFPNVFGTKNILDFAVKKSVESFLYFSSGEVYGEPDTEVVCENDYGFLDPTNIRSCYAESKRMGESLCVAYAVEHGVPVKIVRPFHTYGPGMKLDDGRVFADFVANIVRNENIEMKSSGKSVRSFCYLADATIGFFTILLKGANQHAYNMGNPNESISIKDLAELLISLFPEKKLKVMCASQSKNYLESPVHSQLPNISKIGKLGWIPKTTIQEGFFKTVNSYNL